MSSRDKKDFSAFSLVWNIFAIPYSFVIGFILGLAAPVAAIAAAVAGVRLLTGRMPFLSLGQKGDAGERQLAVELVPPDEVEARFEVQKEQITSELGVLKEEIQSIIEQARAEGEQAAKATPEA
jgi:hypothetical protein